MDWARLTSSGVDLRVRKQDNNCHLTNMKKKDQQEKYLI